MAGSGTELVNTLSSGVARTCLCWKLTRADGVVVGATEHDRPIAFDGVTYEPGAAFDQSGFSTGAGLAPGRADMAGALVSDAIDEEDLRAGLWDGAKVDVYRADWSDVTRRAWVWSGRLTAIRQTGGSFEAELVSLKAGLERPVGHVYARSCDAVLGDERCGVDLHAPGLEGAVCDHSLATCRDVFANVSNFRGFPHLPGPDFILSGPAESGNDGGRR